MLEAKEVVKSVDGFRALDSATLTVPKGTVYGLVGPNGAGKSTIIRHFTGVYRPDSGQLLLEGAPIWENTDAKRRMVVIPMTGTISRRRPLPRWRSCTPGRTPPSPGSDTRR